MTLTNFGTNFRFTPRLLLTPASKDEVLACLKQHRGHKIRAFGSLHSWSEVAGSRDIALDLRKLGKVTLTTKDDGSVEAEIEAGCTIDALLDYLGAHGDYTLPTCSIIGKQTVAGAIATATHGSGRASFSHYVSAVSVAAYDGTSGSARVYEHDSGEALRAARCGIGCTGIVLSIRMPVQPDYLIEETTGWFDRIEQVLDQEREYPRQQFYLVPWSWRWYGQLRRPLSRESGAVPSASATMEHLARLIGVDIIFNGIVRLLAGTLRWRGAIRWLYRRGFPMIARSDIHVVDRSRRLLMMRHDLYTHVEMELFVAAPFVARAAAFVEWVLRRCAGESLPMPGALAQDDFGRDVDAALETLSGTYVHDYLITFRQVLRDDTLISMTSGNTVDAWYAISLITYQRVLAPFLEMARLVAAAMASAYQARPHWGKICPLDANEIARLYPDLPQFRAHCAAVDPGEAFVNDFAQRTLGF